MNVPTFMSATSSGQIICQCKRTIAKGDPILIIEGETRCTICASQFIKSTIETVVTEINRLAYQCNQLRVTAANFGIPLPGSVKDDPGSLIGEHL